MSKTKVTMQISLVMNAINVAGNAIGIFVLHAGVAGVAWPSTLSRAFAAVAMTALCFSQKNQVCLLWKDLLTWNSSMVRRLLRIAVPNSIENGLFQLAKVALSSISAMFGTVQIAANGVAQSIWSLAALVGSAMGPAFILSLIHISITKQTGGTYCDPSQHFPGRAPKGVANLCGWPFQPRGPAAPGAVRGKQAGGKKEEDKSPAVFGPV